MPPQKMQAALNYAEAYPDEIGDAIADQDTFDFAAASAGEDFPARDEEDPSVLKERAEQGRDHAGLILVNRKTIPQKDFGGLAPQSLVLAPARAAQEGDAGQGQDAQRSRLGD
jgi:hypothetical protein